jgi:amidase
MHPRAVIRQPMDKNTDINAPDFKEVRAMVDRAVSDLRARGAEVIDPIEIPDLLGLLEGSGTQSSTYEVEQATNAYLAQHSDAPVRTYKAIVESLLLVESRRKEMRNSLGHLPTEAAFLLQLLTREALRTQTLNVMADNRLDALVYATFDHVPTRLPLATPGTNRLLSTFLGYPALTVPGGYSSADLPLGLEFLGLPFAEGTLFKAADDFEQSTKYRQPPSITPALSR